MRPVWRFIGMARKLKIFRTPIGFHDAYVAATSRKAALAAWGSDADLFARGIAEEVTDPALTAAPLADPGAVIRVARGSAEEHMAALPRAAAKRAKAVASDEPAPTRTRTASGAKPRPKPKPKPKPRPSRVELEQAEAALATATDDFDACETDLAEREAAIARERTKLDRDRAARLRRLTAARDEAKEDYARKLADWEP